MYERLTHGNLCLLPSHLHSRRSPRHGAHLRLRATSGHVEVPGSDCLLRRDSGRVARGDIFRRNVTPGRHTLGTRGGVPVSISVLAGEEAFVELSWHVQTGAPPIPVLFGVAPSLAQTKMKFLSYVPSGRILSSSVEKSDPRGTPSLQLKKRNGSTSQ